MLSKIHSYGVKNTLLRTAFSAKKSFIPGIGQVRVFKNKNENNWL